MSAKNNIVEQIRERIALAAIQGQRGVILQPGAIGDCILTLSLAELMKETVCRGGVDIIGHMEYISIFPGRSRIDTVRSMETMNLHRLFVNRKEFELADGDPLIFEFADYAWIATFLGEPDSDFEWNLIFTAHCSHSAEIMTLSAKPAEGYGEHISSFYKKQFIEQSGLSFEAKGDSFCKPMIRPAPADMKRGIEILAEHGIVSTGKQIVIQPGSGGKFKCWHIDNFLSVARMLQREGMEAIFLLGPAEIERFDELTIRKIEETCCVLINLSLAEVLAVLSIAAGYIGNDSGITHLSASMGIRTVAIFGPTDPGVYGPVGPSVNIMREDEPDFIKVISKETQKKVVNTLLR